MTTGPTPEQTAAQVALIPRDRPDARVIGIHAPGPWLSGTTLTVQDETFPVAYFTSALQVSEAPVSDPAWAHLLMQHLGLCNGRPDAVALLAWSVEPQHLRRYEGLSAELRTAVHQRLRETAGAVGATMLEALEAGHGGLLLPIGLVCEGLFAPSGQRQIGIAQTRGQANKQVSDLLANWNQGPPAVERLLPIGQG